MNIYNELHIKLEMLTNIFAQCCDTDHNYLIKKDLFLKLDKAFNDFENVAKCFIGFEHTNDYKNAIAIAKRAVEYIKNYSKTNICLDEMEYCLVYYHYISALLLLGILFNAFEQNDDSFSLIVIENKSESHNYALIDYLDYTDDTPTQRKAAVSYNDGLLVIGVIDKDVMIQVTIQKGNYKLHEYSMRFNSDIKFGINVCQIGGVGIPDNRIVQDSRNAVLK